MVVYLNGNQLSLEEIERVARGGEKVQLTDEAKGRVRVCRDVVRKMVDSGEAIYGVTTGIGEFARIRVSPEMGRTLQENIILSHAAGTGDLQPEEAVRAAMVMRVNTLSKGYSGVRLSTIETYMEQLNRGITPLVYEKGSVGTSGDLSPLAQLAEVVIGKGEAFYKGERLPGAVAMERAGLKPVELSFKEGLGLINGSQMMTGQSGLLLIDTLVLLKNAMIASAMTLDALRAVQKPFDARVHAIRPYYGQGLVAENLRKLFANSEILAKGSSKVQDGYSLRCTPQAMGPSIDAYHYVKGQVEIELNSAADNPLFFPEDNEHIAAGNFHGQPVAMAMDFLGIALAELADLSERHTNRLLNPTLSGLPDFLIEGMGVNSGLMVAQYTAAALVSENKVLAHPAVVDSISVSADQEDHVSMGPIAVRKCKEILQNVQAVIAIEMLCAAQAMDFHKPSNPGTGTKAAYDVIREKVPFMKQDRALHPDINMVAGLVRDGSIVKAVEAAVGEVKV
jgi:histidine ammonia-lyase